MEKFLYVNRMFVYAVAVSMLANSFIPALGEGFGAPSASMVAVLDDETWTQESRLLYSNWEDDHFQSQPFQWPEALDVKRGSDISIEIQTPKPPTSATFLIWERVNRNGLPRGRPVRFACSLGEAKMDTCRIMPKLDGPDTRWVVHLPPQRGRRLFIGTAIDWGNERAVWENHLVVR